MSDTNFVGGVVKILETPKQNIINNNILVTSFRVQFPQVRKNCIVHLKFWGNLARDVETYYKINDYILIEGYLSLSEKQTSNLNGQTPKKIEITVLKIYPFLLSYDRFIMAR
jgi:single-stranded DNA-binding protein